MLLPSHVQVPTQDTDSSFVYLQKDVRGGKGIEDLILDAQFPHLRAIPDPFSVTIIIRSPRCRHLGHHTSNLIPTRFQGLSHPITREKRWKQGYLPSRSPCEPPVSEDARFKFIYLWHLVAKTQTDIDLFTGNSFLFFLCARRGKRSYHSFHKMHSPE